MSWRDARLGDLVSLHTAQVKPGASPGRLFEHYSIPAFDEGMKPVLEPGYAIKSNKVSVPSGAVLLSKLNPRICRVWAADPSGCGDPVASTEFLVLVPRAGTDRAFLRYALQSPSFRDALASRVTGTSGSHQRVQPAAALDLVVPAPPVRMQERIGAILKALDDKIELNRRMNETLEQIAAACFSHWFSRGGQQNDDGVGAGVARDIVEFDPTERLKRGTVAPHLGLAELPTEGPIHQPPRLRPFTSGARFRNRDTLLARITPSLENGKTALANGLPHGIVAWGSTEIIVMRARQGVPFSVPYLLARDASFRARAVRSMSGTSGRQRVPREALEDEPISIPPKHRLLELGELVDPMFDAMFAKARESETLAGIRDALLPKLISGDLRIPDAERVVGEVV